MCAGVICAKPARRLFLSLFDLFSFSLPLVSLASWLVPHILSEQTAEPKLHFFFFICLSLWFSPPFSLYFVTLLLAVPTTAIHLFIVSLALSFLPFSSTFTSDNFKKSFSFISHFFCLYLTYPLTPDKHVYKCLFAHLSTCGDKCNKQIVAWACVWIFSLCD